MHLARGRSEEAQPRAGLRFWRKRGFFSVWGTSDASTCFPGGALKGDIGATAPSRAPAGLSSFGVSMIFDDMDRPWR